jgi:hypothetical protein
MCVYIISSPTQVYSPSGSAGNILLFYAESHWFEPGDIVSFPINRRTSKTTRMSSTDYFFTISERAASPHISSTYRLVVLFLFYPLLHRYQCYLLFLLPNTIHVVKMMMIIIFNFDFCMSVCYSLEVIVLSRFIVL